MLALLVSKQLLDRIVSVPAGWWWWCGAGRIRADRAESVSQSVSQDMISTRPVPAVLGHTLDLGPGHVTHRSDSQLSGECIHAMLGMF